MGRRTAIRRAVTWGGGALAAYALVGRRRMLRWGAKREEASGTLPGDGLVPDADAISTMAIRIDAPPEHVWPWIAQVGQGRGGFYSYTWLENGFGRIMKWTGALPHGVDIHNADRVLPEFQDVKVGDRIRFAAEPGPTMTVAEVAPRRALVLRSDESLEGVPSAAGSLIVTSAANTWSFILEPQDDGSTRLVARTRGRTRPGLAPRVSSLAFWEPAHFVMQRRMLKGVKRRAEQLAAAEGAPRSAPASRARPASS